MKKIIAAIEILTLPVLTKACTAFLMTGKSKLN